MTSDPAPQSGPAPILGSYERRMSARLIGDMNIADFNREVRERRVAKFDHAINAEDLDKLYNIGRLESIILKEIVPALYVDVVVDGMPRKLIDAKGPDDDSNLDTIRGSLTRGATIRVCDVQKFDPMLEAFVREVQTDFQGRCQVNAYLSPPNNSGFRPHFDTTDIFIVQCSGSKRWNLYPDYSNQVELPLLETPWDPGLYRPAAEPESMTLHRGDVLYLPRGAMHEAFCNDHESLHLTISLAPLTMAGLAERAFRRMLQTDIDMRRRLDWATPADAATLARLNRQVRQMLTRWVETIDIADLIEAEQKDLFARPMARAGDGDGLQSTIDMLVKRAGEVPR